MLFTRLYEFSPPSTFRNLKPALAIPLPNGEVINTRIYERSPLDILSTEARHADFARPGEAGFKPAILVALPAENEAGEESAALSPQQTLVFSRCLEVLQEQTAICTRAIVQQALGIHYLDEQRDAITDKLLPDVFKITMTAIGNSRKPNAAVELILHIRACIDENLPVAGRVLFGEAWSLERQKMRTNLAMGIRQALRDAHIPITRDKTEAIIAMIQPGIDMLLTLDMEENQGHMLATHEGERRFMEYARVLAALHRHMFPVGAERLTRSN